MLPFALGLSASLCWGLADFVAGMETRRLPGLVVVCLSQVVGLVGLIGLAAALGEIALDSHAVPAVLAAGLSSSVGVIVLYRALAIGPMGVVAPLSATGAVVPIVVGLAEGEAPTEVQVLGIAAAAVGVLLVAQDVAPGKELKGAIPKGVALALLAALCLGITLAALDRAAASGAVSAVLWSRMTAVAVLCGVLLILKPPLTGVRSRFPRLASIGVLDAGANTLYALATTQGLLALVAIVASLYPVATLILARVFLAERLHPRQSAGIGAAMVGVVLIVGG